MATQPNFTASVIEKKWMEIFWIYFYTRNTFLCSFGDWNPQSLWL